MTDQAQNTKQMTAETVGLDLLQGLVDEIRLLQEPWEKMDQFSQQELIDRLKGRVADNVKTAVHLLAEQGRTTVVGTIEQTTIKDGVKTVIKFSPKAHNLHELYDATNMEVLLVVADATNNTGGMNEVAGEEDQRGMDLGHEHVPDSAGSGMGDEVVDAEFSTDDDMAEQKPLGNEDEAA